MKQPTQSVIDDARRYDDEEVAYASRAFTKDGAAEFIPEQINREAEALLAYGRLETITEAFTAEQARGRLDTWLEGPWFFGAIRRDLYLEIVAIALERGELPPPSLCEYAAKALRHVIKENVRGTLLYRDSCIASLLRGLERRGFPLFPNRARRAAGKTIGFVFACSSLKKGGLLFSRGPGRAGAEFLFPPLGRPATTRFVRNFFLRQFRMK